MTRGCNYPRLEFQPFPTQGGLAQRIDCELPGFTDQTLPPGWEQGRVFSYVLTTVAVHDREFRQNGGATGILAPGRVFFLVAVEEGVLGGL